jgi:hypothetical protein
MKAKTIKAILRKKIDQWLETIEDVKLRQLASKNIIVTGGCIASMLLGEQVNDFDLYCRDHATTLGLANYYLAHFKPRMSKGIAVPLKVKDEDGRVSIVVKSAGIVSENGTEKAYEYFEGSPDQAAAAYVGEVMNDPGEIEDTYQEVEKLSQNETTDEGKPKYRPVFLTTNAITLSDKIQIIMRFYGEPDEIHKNYDFVHCTNYWSSWDSQLVLRQEALEALLSKELRYIGSKYPICSVVRLRKFIARGWQVNAGQILKMAMQISALDLNDLEVLRDQLTGVDTAYFMQLIDRLKEKDPVRVESVYLVEIIDRMF